MNRSATRRPRSSRSRSPSSGSALPLTESISDAEGRGPQVKPESTRNAALRSIRSMGRVQFQHDFGIFTTLIMGDIGQTHGTWTCRSGGGRHPDTSARFLRSMVGGRYRRMHTPAGCVQRSVVDEVTRRAGSRLHAVTALSATAPVRQSLTECVRLPDERIYCIYGFQGVLVNWPFQQNHKTCRLSRIPQMKRIPLCA